MTLIDPYHNPKSAISQFSVNELIAGESGNSISSQQLLPQTQVSINYAESLSENISRVDSVLSSNPVLPRDAPSTNQTPPIGLGPHHIPTMGMMPWQRAM